MNRLVIQSAIHVVVIGHGLKSEQLAQRRQSLQLGELRGGNIVLELQQLQLDLDGVAFAEVSGAIALRY